MIKITNIKASLIYISIALLMHSCSVEPVEPGPPLLKYSFFTAGHAYGAPGVDNDGVHPPLSEVFPYLNEREEIELGIFTGDVVLKSSKENWEELASDLDGLDAESHIAPGNHDLGDIEQYEEYIGETNYNFSHKGDLFVILETTTTNWNITSDKITSLKAEIDSSLSPSDRIFIFCHQLIWYEEGTKYDACPPNSTEGKAGTTDFFSDFLPMLNKLEQEVVIYAGDIGAFANGCAVMYEELDNVTLIASGMGGGIKDNLIIANIFDTGEISYEIIALNGDDKSKLGVLEDYRI